MSLTPQQPQQPRQPNPATSAMPVTHLEHEAIADEMQALVERLATSALGDTITFSPPLSPVQEEWFFRFLWARDIGWRYTRIEDPGYKGMFKVFRAKLLVNSITRIR